MIPSFAQTVEKHRMGKNRLYLNLSVINCWTSSILIKLAAIFMAYGYL